MKRVKIRKENCCLWKPFFQSFTFRDPEDLLLWKYLLLFIRCLVTTLLVTNSHFLNSQHSRARSTKSINAIKNINYTNTFLLNFQCLKVTCIKNSFRLKCSHIILYFHTSFVRYTSQKGTRYILSQPTRFETSMWIQNSHNISVSVNVKLRSQQISLRSLFRGVPLE